jgi:molybdopterin synthase sulfurtransferase
MDTAKVTSEEMEEIGEIKEKIIMKKNCRLFVQLILVGLMSALFWGCGSSTDHKNTGGNANTPSKPLTGDVSLFPNTDLLASAEDLLTDINVKNSDHAIIMDTRSADAYAFGHIPGAINMEWTAFVLWNALSQKTALKPVAGLESQLGALGLTRTSRIVIYDDTRTSWGSAGRIFWMLEYLGCVNVQILNGGWDKWEADGLPTETTANTLNPAQFNADLSLFAGINVDKEHIHSRLKDDDFVTVDTRTDEEYNGWTLYGEARGGHIPGAVQLPYEKYYNGDNSILSYADLKALLDSHGITADKEVVAYCTAGIRSGFFYFLARLMGYNRVANYDGSMWDWAAADAATYPMDKMKNYQALVYPAWVDALIKGQNPPTYPGNGYVILFTSWEARYSENRSDYIGTPYETGHIPGAIFMDTYAIENGPNSEYGDGYQFPEEGNAKPVAQLQTMFGNIGISKDKTVVVYADDDISMMTAGRVAWALLLAGVDDVRILNGSYDAWTAYGGAIETTPNTLAPVAFGSDPGNTEYLATTNDLKDVVNGANPDAVIVDDREWAEFIGDSNSYYHYFHELGRIATAQWIGDWVEVVGDDLQSLKPYTEVEKNWTTSGFSPDKKMLFYCGTGWRSAVYTFYAYLMGRPAANYDGGWFEWSYYGNTREKGHTDKLISAQSLNEIKQNNNNGKPLVIIETGWGPAGNTYNSGHIPGAVWVNTDEIEYDCFNPRNDWPVDAGTPACWDRSTTAEEDAAKGLSPDDALPRNWWNIYPDQYLLPAIAYMGIDKNTTVVVYARSVSAAARLVWTLMYAGVEDVRLLDGAKTGWTNAGYPMETVANARRPVDFFDPDDPGRTTAIHPEYKVDIPYVRNVVNGIEADALMVDIRTWNEYVGATAPYSYIPTSGRVPGAVWGKAGSGTSGMQDYVNDDGTLKSLTDIYRFWREQGITSDKHLNFYCGTAWRSSLAWFNGYMMGFAEISNFDSSWFEWSMGEGSAYNGDDPVLNPIVDENPGLP